jgi:PAS domain S-box-containing protein
VKEDSTVLRMMAELNRRTNVFEFDQLVRGTLGFLHECLQVGRASVALLCEEPKGFTVFDAIRPIAGLNSGTFLPFDASALGQVVRTGQTLYRPDLRMTPARSETAKLLESQGLRTLLLVPLKVEQKCLGCLNVAGVEVDAFSDEQRSIIELAAARLAYALQAADHLRSVRASEARFRSFFEVAREGFVVVDMATRRFLMGNPAFAAILGRTADEISKLSVPDIHPPEAMPTVDAAFATMARGARPVVSDLPVLRKDGSLFYADISAQLFMLEERQCLVAVFRDATERRRREEELVNVQKLESIRTLAAGIAHDFNNLLTGIMGNLSLAEMSLHEPNEARVLMGEARGACTRAAALTRQLLTFSKGGSPIKATMDVVQVVSEAATLAVRGSNVRLDIARQDEIWSVHADPGQIAQVIQNLVINAVQAMPEGGDVNVRLANETLTSETARPPLRPGEYVQIAVEDHGCGIPPENLDRIFLPFFTTKTNCGSGLGLAVVYSIVRNHDGDVKVESVVDRGTIFRVWIPARASEAQATVADAESLKKGQGRVLVMDDEPVVRATATNILSHAGYDITCVSNGAEAVETFFEQSANGHPFEVVILDLTVPGGMNGQAAARAILQRAPEARIIVSSGYSEDRLMSEFVQHGIAGILPKPYTPIDLCRVVNQVIKAPRRV